MLTVGFFYVFKVCSLPLFPKQLFFKVVLEHLGKKKEKLICGLVSCSVGVGMTGWEGGGGISPSHYGTNESMRLHERNLFCFEVSGRTNDMEELTGDV